MDNALYTLPGQVGIWRKGQPSKYPAKFLKVNQSDLIFTLLHYALNKDHTNLAPVAIKSRLLEEGETVETVRDKRLRYAKRLKRLLDRVSEMDACVYSTFGYDLVLYPPPSHSFQDILRIFLSEPVGKVWLVYGQPLPCRKSHGYYKEVSSLDLPSTAFGPSVIRAPDTTILAENIWRISHEGQSRFDLLWNCDTWYQPSRNPWKSIHARSNSSWKQFYIVIDGALDTWPRYEDSYPPYLMDTVAALSSIVGHTSLSSSELVVLINFLFGDRSGIRSSYKTDRSRRISSILMVDILSHIREDEMKAVDELLRSSDRFKNRAEEISWDWFSFPHGDIRLPDPPDLLTHRELFELWMLARAQLGRSVIHTKEVTLERYLDITRS